jgi:hypothetical protein
MCKFEEYLEKLEKSSLRTDPEFFSWYIDNITDINKAAVKYKPPELYRYMITFTIDPKKVLNQNDPEIQDIIEKYIVKLISAQADVKAYYVKEHPESNVHWHTVIVRNSAIKSRSFIKNYVKKYGNVDISKSFAENDSNSVKYLSKDSNPIYIDL